MSREYYVIKSIPVAEDSGYTKGYELVKYNTSKQSSRVGNVYQTSEGRFISDDCGFKRHKNELVSRRIKIVKKHLELGEPAFAAYWLNKNNVDCFKV